MPVGNPITYDEVETLRVAIPLGVIEYSQARINDYTDRRSDCSGLISYVWALPTSGPGTWLKAYTTQSLWEQGLIKEIPRSELRPGDAIGKCGPGTANGGGGHIALFRGASGDRVHVWDHGSGMGPKDRWVTWNSSSTGWLAPGACKAWRYVHMEDDMALRDDPDGRALMERVENMHNLNLIIPADAPNRGEGSAFVKAFLEMKAKVDSLATGGVDVDELVDKLVPALAADPAFKALLVESGFQSAQRAERE